MKLLTKEQQESFENAKICYICQEKTKNKYLRENKYCKVRDNFHYTEEFRGVVHTICNLKFHNGSNYDYHFIIKKLVEEFKKQFTCLQENTEKYITFTVPIEKKSCNN